MSTLEKGVCGGECELWHGVRILCGRSRVRNVSQKCILAETARFSRKGIWLHINVTSYGCISLSEFRNNSEKNVYLAAMVMDTINGLNVGT